jgi:effector-binding domain-containing protein
MAISGGKFMTRSPILLVIIVLVLAAGYTVLSAADNPENPATTKPSLDSSPSTTDMRVQSLKGYTYAFVSTDTTLNTLQDAIGVLIPKLESAMDAGQLRVEGPAVFTYHSATMDRDKKFTLDVGIIVKDGSTAPPGFTIAVVPAATNATVLYTGNVQGMPPAYGKLYGEMARQGLQPTDVSREVYLYWEGTESPNNVVQLRAELAAGL